MDLISKRAAIEAVRELLLEPDSTQYIYSSDAICAVKSVPSVPAVPLDKLCEWLGKVAIFRCCECTSNCCDGEECSSSNHFDKEIKKWMENECGDE